MQRRTALDPLQFPSPSASSGGTRVAQTTHPRRRPRHAGRRAGPCVGLAGPAPAGAPRPRPGADDGGPGQRRQGQGLLDPVLADFIERSIAEAEDAGVVAVVLQLDSPAPSSATTAWSTWPAHIHDAAVPSPSGSGPSGSQRPRRRGPAGRRRRPDRHGPGRPARQDRPARHARGAAVAGVPRRRRPARERHRRRRPGRRARDHRRKDAPVIGEFLIDLPGVRDPRRSRSDGRTGPPARRPRPVFSALPRRTSCSTPWPARRSPTCCFVIGLALHHLRALHRRRRRGRRGRRRLLRPRLLRPGRAAGRPWALGAARARDVRLRRRRADRRAPGVDGHRRRSRSSSGSLMLYDGVSSCRGSRCSSGIVGMALAMLAGMPAMVRTRFSTPTIGREWMIGEEGEAVTDVVARRRGAGAGAPCGGPAPTGPRRSTLRRRVRVVEIDGLVLEVEPLEGGAVDYREKRRGGDDGDRGDGDGRRRARADRRQARSTTPERLTWHVCPTARDPALATVRGSRSRKLGVVPR